MTAQTIYRLLCDAPHCTVSTVQDRLTPAPAGWREIRSTGHLDLSAYPVTTRGRRRSLSRSEILVGQFSLTLCPDHGDVFDAHLPQTSGGGQSRRTGSTFVDVSCSCGARFPVATAVAVIGQTPSYEPERVWWRHLPAELRWYATREPLRSEATR